MRLNWPLALRVAATFMGTVVGAGFASGQETLQFFVTFGRAGTWGLLIATSLFCLFGVLTLELGHELKVKSHRELLLHTCGPVLGSILDAAVTLFLFAALAIMLAGSGALVAEQLGWPALAGTGLTVLLTLLTLLYGLGGILAANTLVVPLLVLASVTLSLLSLRTGAAYSLTPVIEGLLPAAPNWLLAAILYVAYNLILSISVLGPLGAQIEDRQALRVGGIIGGLGLGLVGLAIKGAIGRHLPEIASFEVPMLFLARFHPWPIQLFYTLVLWAEIYTTAISSAFGFVARLSDQNPWGDGALTALTLLFAWVASGVGFSRLVGTLYPAFGYASLLFLGLLIWRAWRPNS